MKLSVTDRGGTAHELAFTDGQRLMHLLRDADLGIRAECDGNCACATCHVYVTNGWMEKLPSVGDEEEDMLDEACEPEDNSRLSCQIILSAAQDGMEITIARDWD